MFALTPADEQKLVGVHPRLVAVVRRAAQASPMRFRVVEGLRSIERQRELVASGASTTMNSRHLTGHAVDIAPADENGKISWDWPLYRKLAPIMKAAAKAEGVPIEWGGDWKSFKDGPHWQLPFSQFPKAQRFAADVESAPPYTLETESAAATKSVTTAAGGSAIGAALALEPLGKAVDTLTSQQAELTSGDVVRIALALAIIGLTGWIAWRKAKS
ncbi:M15 family metallopeptidase [Bosea sp. ASV33]|uniref:M15 family metallopeptidase n=1 Tax=Bosea sp. ASV33 TaxID=2795106 RepID=UPI0018ED223E|nr:M15 family metallopeptidase [Bosea sp. ASV33]